MATTHAMPILSTPFLLLIGTCSAQTFNVQGELIRDDGAPIDFPFYMRRYTRPIRSCDFSCPLCGENSRVQLPTTGTSGSSRCRRCERVVLAPPDKHCVYCAYASVPCTDMQ